MYTWNDLKVFCNTIPAHLLNKNAAAWRPYDIGDFTGICMGSYVGQDKHADYTYADPSWPSGFPFLIDESDYCVCWSDCWSDLKTFVNSLPSQYLNNLVIVSGDDFCNIEQCVLWNASLMQDEEDEDEDEYSEDDDDCGGDGDDDDDFEGPVPQNGDPVIIIC